MFLVERLLEKLSGFEGLGGRVLREGLAEGAEIVGARGGGRVANAAGVYGGPVVGGTTEEYVKTLGLDPAEIGRRLLGRQEAPSSFLRSDQERDLAAKVARFMEKDPYPARGFNFEKEWAKIEAPPPPSKDPRAWSEWYYRGADRFGYDPHRW